MAVTPGAFRTGSSMVIRFGAIGGTVAAVLLGWWVSLLVTSDPLDDEQRGLVDDAIVLLDERGFSR